MMNPSFSVGLAWLQAWARSALLLALLTCSSASPAGAQESTTPERQAQQLLEAAIAQGQSAGMAAGYASQTDRLWIGYQGYADVDASLEVDASTLLRPASIAKPMTAIAIMQLVEQGKVSLDVPVTSYLPSFPINGGEAITLRHLLGHSSGIKEYKSKKEARGTKEYATLAEAMEVFQDRPLAFEPGSKFGYTSYGYLVAGWVLEQVTGMSYEAYMQQHIWEPAGMKHTGVEEFEEVLPGASKLYFLKGKGEKARPKSMKRTNLSNRVPGGGLYTTVEDILKFGQAVLNHRLVNAETLKQMWENTGLKTWGNPYGLGWYLYGENPVHGPVYGHSGAQAGSSAQLMILPQAGLVTCVLSNTAGANRAVSEISVKLFDLAAKAAQP